MLRAEPVTRVRWMMLWARGRLGLLCAGVALACAAAHAQATPLTAVDFSSNTDHASPHDLAVANGLVLFGGSDGVHGDELWATDGTCEGRLKSAAGGGRKLRHPGHM